MKLITGLATISLFVILSVPVLAENTATTSTKAQNLKELELRSGKVQETVETRIEKLEPNKKLIVRRIRNSIIVRYGVYEKLIERSGNLLTKLQERIDKAQKAGFNTRVVDGYMTDAKDKLADAQANLNSIKALKDTAIDKTTFQSIQKKFIIIHKDLNAVRQDGAKIIAELKKYNSDTPKLTPKPTKTATTSASVKF